MKKTVLIVIAIIVGIVVLCFTSIQMSRNGAINLEEQIATALSNIDVQQKRRADLIPNLVDCVKAYDKHEYEVLMNVIQARGANNDKTVDEVQTMIAAVAEAYPELKSNTNYKELMNELSITENLIANYRNNYNYQVRDYKVYVRKFPNNFLLPIIGYEEVEYEYLNLNAPVDAPTNLFD